MWVALREKATAAEVKGFLLRRDQREQAQDHFIQWYKDNGLPWIEQRVQQYADRIGVTPGSIKIRNLGYRWGSCSKSEHLNFHWRTMQLPPRIIEYVIVHELVHLLEPHHRLPFWQRLERSMPDYVERKQWLAENGGQF
jgi:Predicted metal-dependent hydrolase